MRLSSLHARLKLWRFALGVLALSFLLACFGDAGRAVFRYQAALIPEAEFWRALTGHLVHLGWGHFWLNAAGFIGIWWLYGDQYRARVWALIFLICCAGISAGFLLFDPQMDYYVGLSGVLHGLLCAGAMRSLSRGGGLSDSLILLGTACKIVFEQTLGAIPFTQGLSGDTVIVNAHFYGAVWGLIFTAIYGAAHRSRKEN